jgi:hypothetical protein
MAQSSTLMLWYVCIYLKLLLLAVVGTMVDQETIVTSGFRGNIIYGYAAHKSLITILFTIHLYFISICMHSWRENL